MAAIDRCVKQSARVLVRGRLFRDAASLLGRGRGRRPSRGDVSRCRSRLARADSRTARRCSIGSLRIAGIDLNVIYAAHSVAHRAWTVEPKHRHVFLRGVDVPGAERAPAPRISGYSRNRPRAPQRATRCRCRLRLEHVRVAEGDRLVPHSSMSRTCSWSRATISIPAAAWRQRDQGSDRPATGRGRLRMSSRSGRPLANRSSRGARPRSVSSRTRSTFPTWNRRARPARNGAERTSDMLVLSVARLVPEKGTRRSPPRAGRGRRLAFAPRGRRRRSGARSAGRARGASSECA